MHKHLIAALSAVGMLALPAAATADRPDHHHHALTVARQQCRTERHLIGVPAFRVKYGAPEPFANCVRLHRPTDRSAAQACRTERKTVGAKAFALKYGVPHALNRCIKAHPAT